MEIKEKSKSFTFSHHGRYAIFEINEHVFSLLTDLEESDKLIDMIKMSDYDKQIKGILLTNIPGSFGVQNYEQFLTQIIGGDNTGPEDIHPSLCDKRTRFREIIILNKIIEALISFQKLVFVGVRGEVVTPFLGLVLSSDFCFASDDVSFVMAHNNYGLHPSGCIPFLLTRELGHSRALDVMFAQRIDVSEAKDLGFVSKVLPTEDFLEEVIKEMEKFNSIRTCTIRDTKRLTQFTRKELKEYVQFEAGLLNL